ncbi:MAG: fatty acyl-AMP ligase [Okeania sp. SIO3B5]|uniref:fatty acyl-AMP ligase n=1 Tax=Okeania sp. SIO3B5 TaxID=2607811 RepID=UPI0013FFC466|nr:fatty acyl-AMP ligase [Okeania sp. SIO3B5]NEO57900.1 fatty acyl-AMP ligase [Okeania sp. SIO3B5]
MSETVKYSTLIDLLQTLSAEQPEKLAYTFLVDGKKEGENFTYASLEHRVRAIAAFLQKNEVKGERGLLLYPQGLEAIAAFCACLYSGVIAIPVPPPEAGRLKRTLPRLRAIVQDAQASIVLTTATIISLVEEVADEFPEFETMRWIDTESVDLEIAQEWKDPGITGDTLAYLQYTSGSTSTPKGVMLTHKNLIHHLGYLQRACGYTPESKTITWMPFFHDYGLVEGMMEPLYNGTPCYIMSPFSFVKQPLRWLQAMSNYKATHSQAPNFAYDLCVRRVKPKQLSTLDLSNWEAAGNAAEPINPKVMESFYGTFLACGFRWSAFAPCYGLAEDTLLVSAKPKLTEPILCTIDATALVEKNKIVKVSPDATGVRAYPSCGRLVCETQVAIVNPETLAKCATDEVGEIWVSDPSVAQGYWERPEATKETFQGYIKDSGEGPFLRTGDLGFMKDGELYITGRIKDLIIIRGTNHYPQDIEWTVQQVHPALRPDYGAAFSVEVRGDEHLVIVQEVERRTQDLDTEKVINDIRQAVSEDHELQAYAVILAKPGNILKTASGKIQRRACRSNFMAGTLDVISDWSENPQLTSKYRKLQEEVESLASQMKNS